VIDLRRPGAQTAVAAVAYVALTVVMTWPLGANISNTVPGDLGDSLLVMGVMAWVGDGLVGIGRGEMRFADLWQGYFFAPTPLSLTFSEHFVPQAAQALPAYLATGNILLAYNLVFMATFALSGLGTFLFVRELTGSARAGFVAGLFYAFFPYRLNQYPHLQTLSSQWIPFVLCGFRRHFDTGRWLPLIGGTAAFVVQGLSSGYYLFYVAPVLAGYVVWELAVRGRLIQWRAWLPVAVAGLAALVATLPFLLPYAQAREQFGHARPFGEVLAFSADLLAYVNAPYQLHFWGARLTPWPQVEGDLFAGAVPLVLASAAVLLWLARGAIAVRLATVDAPARERLIARTLGALSLLLVAAALAVVASGGFVWDLAGLPIRMTNVRRTLMYAAIAAVAVAALSPRVRSLLARARNDLTPFLILAIGFAVVMSLGPLPRIGGRQIVGLELYDSFFQSVPGYDGLRVPARFGMVAGALLAVLAGYALARVAAWKRGGTVALLLVATVFMTEVWAVPVPVNLTWASTARYTEPWPSVHRVNDGPLAYRYLVAMPADTVVLEMPFGDQAWDLRYVYYAGLHGKRIVNGYSGYFPDGYLRRAAKLAGLWSDRDGAWDAVRTSGATHLLVHSSAYHAPEADAVIGWARLAGATPLAWFSDGDVLLALPKR
jgi:hypothetical protein